MKNLLSLICIFACACAYGNDSAQFYFQKGLTEKNARRFLTASQAFEAAIKFDAKFVDAYIENGFACLEMRKTDKAKLNFTKASDLEPNNFDATKQLMELHYNYRQYAKAIELATKCKNCENADRIIGISYYHQEEYPAAERFLKSALAKEPNDAEATYTLARSEIALHFFQ